VESFIILAVAAGLSAVVVWWALGQPVGRPKPKEPRRVRKPKEPRRVKTKDAEEDVNTEEFVLLPSERPVSADDRPPSALSVARLALTIAVFAVLGVGVLTILGILLKNQLDRFFGGL
jgi:hypothetical protein